MLRTCACVCIRLLISISLSVRVCVLVFFASSPSDFDIWFIYYLCSSFSFCIHCVGVHLTKWKMRKLSRFKRDERSIFCWCCFSCNSTCAIHNERKSCAASPLFSALALSSITIIIIHVKSEQWNNNFLDSTANLTPVPGKKRTSAINNNDDIVSPTLLLANVVLHAFL